MKRLHMAMMKYRPTTEGLEYFTEWCDEAIEKGNKHVE